MADTQDMLNVPIYINGGNSSPATKLGERELYLNLTTSHLYAGGIGSAAYSPIRAGFADCLSNNSIYINASLGNSTPMFRLGNMTYDFSANKFTGVTSGAYSVEGANLTNVTKLVLSNACYGTSEPSGTAEVGQLYFKIK